MFRRAFWGWALAVLVTTPAEARERAFGRRGEFTISKPKPKKPRTAPESPKNAPPAPAPPAPPPKIHVRLPVRSHLVEVAPPAPPPELATLRVALGLGGSDRGFLARLQLEGEHWFDDGAANVAVGWHFSGALSHGTNAPWRHVEVLSPQLMANFRIAGQRLVAFAGAGPAYVGWRLCTRPLCGETDIGRAGWGFAGAVGTGIFFLPGDGAVHSLLLRVEALSFGGWNATIGYGVGLGGERHALNGP